MVKRRVVTYLDEEVIEKLAEKSKRIYGKKSIYRITAALVLKGLDDIEQGTLEVGLGGTSEKGGREAGGDAAPDWRDILKPATKNDKPRRGKR